MGDLLSQLSKDYIGPILRTGSSAESRVNFTLANQISLPNPTSLPRRITMTDIISVAVLVLISVSVGSLLTLVSVVVGSTKRSEENDANRQR